ncbi:MAG: phage Gp37/Gp68 family protein [Bacteroidales bacterium]|nr:phage Gp37/Gp68 family protein [Bacteroidales bacterium]
MSKTKIAWTERTWNPITGCNKISEGCRHCYAEVMARRLQGMGQKRYANGFQLTLHPEALNEPKKIKQPSMFFVCSMADIFHKDVPFDFIDQIMNVIAETPRHTYQILTKRHERLQEYFLSRNHLPTNMWVGVTVENENHLERIGYLRSLDYDGVKFLSCEPLLGDLGSLDLQGIDWVIVGGESGQQARPMSKEWAMNIQRQCAEQNVPFFFKQWGTYGEDGVKRTKYDNGCLLDGSIYHEMPEAWKGE